MRWDAYDPDRQSRPDVPERAENRDGAQRTHRPEPSTWEAHRRHRTFDDRGVLETETHEAIRVKYRRQRGPDRQLAQPDYKEPPIPLIVALGAALHGAVWWTTAVTWAFAPSPWWALVPFAATPIILGFKFWIANTLVLWVVGSLFIAFDGYTALIMLLPLAGFIAPGRWIRGQW
jgi:hypothetical protein